MHFKALGLAGIGIGLFVIPALGHHSFAMFDGEQTIEYRGTVTEFQWTNPHSWLQVMVAHEDGQMVEWALELSSPGSLSQRGWNPRTVAAGDAVTVTIHPLRDGTPGGQLVTIRLPDGTVMGE